MVEFLVLFLNLFRRLPKYCLETSYDVSFFKSLLTIHDYRLTSFDAAHLPPIPQTPALSPHPITKLDTLSVPLTVFIQE
jgi:hypothetical protein